MEASVRLKDGVTDSFEVGNGFYNATYILSLAFTLMQWYLYGMSSVVRSNQKLTVGGVYYH